MLLPFCSMAPLAMHSTWQYSNAQHMAVQWRVQLCVECLLHTA